MGALKELNKYIRKYKGTMILGALFLTASNFFLVWIPVLIRRTMDQVESLGEGDYNVPESFLDTLFTSEAAEILATNSLMLIGTVMLYGILLFATRQTLIVTSRKIEFDIRNDIVEKLMALPQRYYAENASGETYVRATEDVGKVRDYYGPVIMYSINTVTRAGFVLTMMFLVNPELTFWALIPLPLISFFAYWITGYIHKHSTIIQEQYSTLAGRAKETFSAIRLIKAYNRIDHEQQLFEDESESYRKKKLRLDMIESLFHPALNFLIGISLLIVIWKGGEMVINETITVGNIAEFLIYVAYLIWPVAALGYTTNRFQRSLASWHRIKELMDEPVEIKDSEEKVDQEIEGLIEFKNVGFKYPGSSEMVLENVNLSIQPGENIAIVGRTGSGKSTLVQLIPRLFDPTEGQILLDGIDLKKWSLRKVRDAIGFVPQETFLFSDTIGDNIAFGVEKKFKTMLGERGITLSGGQKQRTAIARALIKDPKILIFDDSLSAVDTKTEDAILKHLRQELSGRSTIMISHRISTIKDADKIYYVEEGRIAESGTHEDLLAKKGRYTAMYNKQLLEQELAEI